KPATSINVRHILCEKQGKMLDAKTELVKGTKFDKVVTKYGEDKVRTGGSLGWISRGKLLPEFEAVAYQLEPSTTSKPIYGEAKTIHGYHIIMVEGRK
ncbi:hypothetical protein GQ44DRAFT_595021, partial [Phaeosphaeriaceae sp. PMI808]